MDWSQTWLSVANTALVRINKQPLQTLDDVSNSALLCNQMIPGCVMNILNLNDWHSARKRVLLAPLMDKPPFGFSHSFQMPSDFVRLVEVCSELPWKREGNTVLSDEDTLPVIYIAYPSAPTELDPLLLDAITTQLAAQLAVSLTADSSLVSLLYQEAEIKIQKAKLQEDAGEPDEKPDFHSWTKAFNSEANAASELELLREMQRGRS